MREHHFEVAVPVEDGEPYLPNINPEDSAHWPQGQVWDVDAEIWMHSDEAWTDDVAACDYLGKVLALPNRIAEIYRQNTDSDGWDIDIMQRIGELLAELNIDVLTSIEQD